MLVHGSTGFTYTYDFNDDWRHLIKVEKTMDANEQNSRPICTAGATACPPEDVGGPAGYSDFPRAIIDPTHTQHLDMWRWHGCPFDPAGFDPNAVNAAMRKLRI